jgi:hypothetical protein
MRRWVQITLGVSGGLVLSLATFALSIEALPEPFGNCSSDETENFPVAVGPGAPQSEIVKRAIAYARESDSDRVYPRFEDTRVQIEDWVDHWKVRFRVPLEKNSFGCAIIRHDGDGPTVWIRKKDMTPYKISLYG